MHTTEEKRQRALLAAVFLPKSKGARSLPGSDDSSLNELADLATTAGAEIVAAVTQKRDEFVRATLMGEGKLLEIKDLAKNEGADVLIFDHELSGSQIRNIEGITGVRTIDRTMLILDIFAARALSAEGKLQVELAQQKYRLPRLTGMGITMSRQGGGIGARGSGESKLEYDRRHIQNRITTLSKKLKELEARREQQAKRREKDGVFTCAIVGYTNAGKSTLLNRLTKAGVLAEDKLFATLDPKAMALYLASGNKILLTDTVGLIRRLPHNLVEAFKSTLETAANADLILHIHDLGDSEEEREAKALTVMKLLSDIGANAPMIDVWNKADTVSAEGVSDGELLAVSATTGVGIDRLLAAIEEFVQA